MRLAFAQNLRTNYEQFQIQQKNKDLNYLFKNKYL